MVLIYSLIDSLAWAGADRNSPNLRSRFETWVRTWMLPLLPASNPRRLPKPISTRRAAEFFIPELGSRTYTSVARQDRFLYAWRTAKVEVLEYAIATTDEMKDHVALHYDDGGKREYRQA